MSKNSYKKRVGIFLLAIVMLFGFTIDVNFNNKSNVYAADGCGTLSHCTGAKKKNGDCKKVSRSTCSCEANASWASSKGTNCKCNDGFARHVIDSKHAECVSKASSNSSSSNSSSSSSSSSTSNNSYTPSSNSSSTTSNESTTTTTAEEPDVDEDVDDPDSVDVGSLTDPEPVDVSLFGFQVQFHISDPSTVTFISNGDATDKKIKIAAVDFDKDEYDAKVKHYKKKDACNKKGVNNKTCAEAYTNWWYANHANGPHDKVITYTPSKHTTYDFKVENSGEYAIFIVYAKKNKKKMTIKSYYTTYGGDLQDEANILNNIAASNTNRTTSADFSSGSACEWAVKSYYKHASDSEWNEYTDALVNKTMGPCFPRYSNGNLAVSVSGDKVVGYDAKDAYVDYNISDEILTKIKEDMASFEKTFEDYISERAKMRDLGIDPDNPKLPDLTQGSDKKWIKVDDPDLSKKGRDSKDKLKDQATNKTGYENAESNKKDMLTCDNRLDNEKTYKYLYYDKAEDVKADMLLFNQSGLTSKKTVAQNVCSYTCREQLAIAFDAPQAVTPGNCFTYKVEIKSTTSCVVKPDFDKIPDFRKYENASCQDTPICGGGNSNKPDLHTASAGPDDEFDLCVLDCDGGKYSDKCINKCFNKAYGTKVSSTSKVSNNLAQNSNNNVLTTEGKESTSSDVIKLKKTDTVKGSKFTESEICKNFPGTLASGTTPGKVPDGYIDAVYDYVNSHVQGSDSATSSDCYWTKYAKYYFKTKSMAALTVCTDHHYKNSWLVGSTTCSPETSYSECKKLGWNKCFLGMYEKGASYYPNTTKDEHNDGVGFRRNENCTWNCKWSKSSSTSVCYDTAGEIEKQFEKDLSSFTGKIADCINTANDCKDNSITYTMTANDDTDNTSTDKQSCEGSNYDQELCRKFPSAKGEEQKKKELNNASHSFPTVVELNAGQCAGKVVDGCDGKTDSYTDANGNKIDCTWKNNTKALITQYHGIITFPGAWIENKHGYVVYDDMSAESQWYKKVSGKYCTPSTAKKVNVKFFDEYLRAKNGCTLDKVSKSTPDVYNIISKVESFGMFDWKFKTGCYYALDDDPEPINTKNCPNPTKTPSCDTTKDSNCKNVSCTGTGCSSIPDSSCDNKTDKTCTTRMGNYVARSYDSQNMFTSSGTKPTSNKVSKSTKVSTSTVEYQAGNVKKVADEKTSASASRQPGFNWSVNATNLSIANYPITPTLLAAKIKSQGDSIYNNDNELDYEIYLNKKNIENIRKITNGDKDYTYFKNGTYKTINNEDYWDAYKNAGYYTDATKLDTSEKGGYDAPSSDIPTIKYYVSKFLRTSPEGSKNTTEGYGSLLRKPSEEALKCNNILNGTACDPLTSYDIDEDTKTTLNNFIKSAS